MSTVSRTRILQALAVTVLFAVVAAWATWPSSDGRVDPRADVPDLETTTAPPTATTPGIAAAPPVPEPPTSGSATGKLPTRLRIPDIGVDAAVVPVGLEPDLQMEVPPSTDVGWYELGPRPGEDGSAVLAAHVDFAGRPGAFFDLADIAVGAEVLVDSPAGTQRFTVTTREQVPKAEVELERYFTAEGPVRLTLITCGGAFSRSTRHYDDNVVITAVPAP